MKRHSRFLMAILSLAMLCGCSKGPLKSLFIRRPTCVHVCNYTETPIVIDGIREEAWDKAIPITGYLVPPDAKKPLSKTEARMRWDDKAIYFYVYAEDKDLFAVETKADSFTCLNDVLEFFIGYKAPGTNDLKYMNFEINALGTVYDAYCPIGGRGLCMADTRWKLWNCDSIQFKIQLDGTLNNYHDEDKGWAMELAIPFDAMPWMEGRGLPENNESWTMHLARYDYSVYLPEACELSSTAPFDQVAFHLTDQFQPLIFKKN